MRYGQIRKYDIANGPGVRTTVFVTGCTHCCFNCFNEEYQSFEAGQEWTSKEEEEILSYVQEDTISGITFLGGEPFQNRQDLLPVLQTVRKAVPQKSIWIYSGYTYEELLKLPLANEMLACCDVLVDGPFVDELKDPALAFRGSSNQRLIDLNKTRESHQVVLYEPKCI